MQVRACCKRQSETLEGTESKDNDCEDDSTGLWAKPLWDSDCWPETPFMSQSEVMGSFLRGQ